MSKSIFTTEADILRSLLRESRVGKGLTQSELSEKLGKPQSYVSKYEIGERRIDVIELREVCGSLGITLKAFVTEFEANVAKTEKEARRE